MMKSSPDRSFVALVFSKGVHQILRVIPDSGQACMLADTVIASLEIPAPSLLRAARLLLKMQRRKKLMNYITSFGSNRLVGYI